jgi:hypothetical protein
MSTENTNNLPSHSVYQVIGSEGKKPYWMKIGAAWANGDGRGFSVQLEALPLTGRIVMREPNARVDGDQETGGQQ